MGTDVSLTGLLADLADLVRLQKTLLQKLDKQEELLRALADRSLHLAHTNEKGNEIGLLLRQRLTEVWEQREFIRAGQEEILRKLAVISKDVDDVERVTREVTGVHKLVEANAAPEVRASFLAAVLKTFREQPAGIKVLLIVLAILIAGHAELTMLLARILGKGGF